MISQSAQSVSPLFGWFKTVFTVLAKAHFSLEQIQTCRSFRSIQAAPKAPKPFHIEFQGAPGSPQMGNMVQHGMTLGLLFGCTYQNNPFSIEHHYSICHVFLID